MENKKYIVAIDLGESNIVVAVGSHDSKGLMSIDSIVSHPCDGVKGGMIENIALVEESLKGAISEVEKSLNIKVMEAYVGISGEFVRFACHSDHVYVSQPQNGVSQGDVNALFDRMGHVQAPDNETIMERIPQNYVVDDAKEVKNPVGSFGRRLSSTFNFILCGNIPMQRLENALKRLGIKMLNSFPNALSVAESVLTPDEKEEGVVVVNLGAGLTDLTIYYRNVVRYIISIPMGASSVNADIRTMMIPDKYIEKLKCKYGSAVADLVPENKVVRVNGRTARESKDIVLYNLAVAIEARMSMLIDFVKKEIAESGYEDKLPYGIVITGGSSKLKNIDELFRRMTDMEVRIGVPIEGISEDSIIKVDDPEYATAVGILLRGSEHGACTTGSYSHVIEPPQEVSPPKKVVVTPPQPPKPPTSSSTIYTPPPPRPYTPPKPVVMEAPASSPKDENQHPYNVPLSEKINRASELAQEEKDQPTDEVEDNDTTTNKDEEHNEAPQKGINFNMKSAFKRVFDKLNKGFDGADDEEI